MNLTNEEKRVRIAMHLGWTWWHFEGREETKWCTLVEPGRTWPSEPRFGGVRVDAPDTKEADSSAAPDYFTSLDAIHEAENAMDTYELKQKFASALYHINESAYIEASYDGEHDYERYFSLLHSTAAQRAEAFGIALNLWPKPPTSPAR